MLGGFIACPRAASRRCRDTPRAFIFVIGERTIGLRVAVQIDIHVAGISAYFRSRGSAKVDDGDVAEVVPAGECAGRGLEGDGVGYA